jgi:hypothetical protein
MVELFVGCYKGEDDTVATAAAHSPRSVDEHDLIKH